jgi:hypothetical protein
MGKNTSRGPSTPADLLVAESPATGAMRHFPEALEAPSFEHSLGFGLWALVLSHSDVSPICCAAR